MSEKRVDYNFPIICGILAFLLFIEYWMPCSINITRGVAAIFLIIIGADKIQENHNIKCCLDRRIKK